jgi:hypothetical protein
VGRIFIRKSTSIYHTGFLRLFPSSLCIVIHSHKGFIYLRRPEHLSQYLVSHCHLFIIYKLVGVITSGVLTHYSRLGYVLRGLLSCHTVPSRNVSKHIHQRAQSSFHLLPKPRSFPNEVGGTSTTDKALTKAFFAAAKIHRRNRSRN